MTSVSFGLVAYAHTERPYGWHNPEQISAPGYELPIRIKLRRIETIVCKALT